MPPNLLSSRVFGWGIAAILAGAVLAELRAYAGTVLLLLLGVMAWRLWRPPAPRTEGASRVRTGPVRPARSRHRPSVMSRSSTRMETDFMHYLGMSRRYT